MEKLERRDAKINAARTKVAVGVAGVAAVGVGVAASVHAKRIEAQQARAESQRVKDAQRVENAQIKAQEDKKKRLKKLESQRIKDKEAEDKKLKKAYDLERQQSMKAKEAEKKRLEKEELQESLRLHCFVVSCGGLTTVSDLCLPYLIVFANHMY